MKASKRKSLPKKKFAAPKGTGPNPSRNQYPIDTKKRAANAKARSTQQMKKGNISKSKRDAIHRAANRVLRKK